MPMAPQSLYSELLNSLWNVELWISSGFESATIQIVLIHLLIDGTS